MLTNNYNRSFHDDALLTNKSIKVKIFLMSFINISNDHSLKTEVGICRKPEAGMPDLDARSECQLNIRIL